MGLDQYQVDEQGSSPRGREWSEPLNLDYLRMPGTHAPESAKAWLTVVVAPDLKEWLRVQAAKHKLSMSAYVERLIEQERHGE